MHFVFERVFHVKHPFPCLFCDENRALLGRLTILVSNRL